LRRSKLLNQFAPQKKKKKEGIKKKKGDERVKSRECAEEVGYLGVGILRGSGREQAKRRSVRARAEKGLCL
jgi:hypothetical protein